jgi:ribosomal protein S18 acetylase RimI-like enzyme
MTDSEFTRAIQENEAEYFATFQTLGGFVEIQRGQDATLLSTGVDFWLFNGVFKPRLRLATAAAQLDEWIRHFEMKKVPFGIFLYPPEKNPEMEEILKAKGFTPLSESHLTVFDTKKMADEKTEPLSAAYTVLEIRNAKQYEGFAQCWAKAFQVPDAFREIFTRFAESYGFDAHLPAQSLAIMHGDRAVAIASYFLDTKVAGLYNIAVDSDFRRQGLGAQITAEIAKRAQKSGLRYLAGIGSVEGMRIYRKFGIHEVGVCRRWYYLPK